MAHLVAKTWQQRDLPGIKAQRDATEATQMGGWCALTGAREGVKAQGYGSEDGLEEVGVL